MTITSSAFKPNESIPPRYTCDGENISPALEFFEVPENTQSLALIVDDPDAPAGTWTHWIVWNINPGIKQITEGATPLGATEGTTSFGKPGYGGPCPPSGQHRYVFKLYALDTVLDLKPSANVAALQSALSSHTIGQAQLMGRYRRQ
ncbi:MAG: YbhB/YbcL family Raf kinase inhibitor-like protein [Candidatus Kerfeldbacteria bacterium]|nr:YbhB/YbcL family Raf kinase inhibitor-like protein [Candidatus Kerfeldbacteria bacterium]